MSTPYVLETGVFLPYEREELFEFFKAAENLERITPPYLNFKILSALPIEMQRDQEIDYSIRLYSVPMRWKTRITSWNPPYYFTDSQIRGPYKKWNHTHLFEARDGGTWMVDRVEYQVPGGPFASLIHRLFVRRKVEAIFEYRKAEILNIFSSEVTDQVLANG